MLKSIKASKIQWANSIIYHYFGIYALHVYTALENYDTEPNQISSLMAFSTIYFGQKIREKDLSQIEDGAYYIYEVYKILLTIDLEDEEKINAINEDLDLRLKKELAYLVKFHKEDIEDSDRK